jgi:hypothetical protein
MSETIPNTEGVAQWFSGESGVAKFGADLPVLGSGLKNFSDSVKGIDTVAVSAASNAALRLSEMAANAPSEGGIKSWFSGDSGVAKFAAELPKVGAAIKGFSDKVTGINVEEVSAASAATRAISALVSNPAESISNMESLGSNLTTFASRLKSFFGTLKNVTDEDRDRVSTILNSLADISKIDMTGLKTTGDSVRDLSDAMSNILKKSYEKLNNLPTTIQEIGKTTITKLCAGLKAEDRITKLKSACKELAITAYDATNNHIKSVAETIGENLVDGFCNGKIFAEICKK